MIYHTHIYSNKLADLPVDDSRISPEMLVDSGPRLYTIFNIHILKPILVKSLEKTLRSLLMFVLSLSVKAKTSREDDRGLEGEAASRRLL